MATLNRLQSHEYQNLLVSQLIRSRLRHSEEVMPPTHEHSNGLFTGEWQGASEREIFGLESLGITNPGHVYRNLSVPRLVEHALIRGEGQLAANGALRVSTGKYTGRSPNDKFIVDEPETHDQIVWNHLNRPISEEHFERLYRKVLDYVDERDLYVFDGYVGADPRYRFGVRVVNEFAWQNLFVHQLFLRPNPEELIDHHPDFTVICVPGLLGDPETDGIRSEAFVVVHQAKGLVIIGGTHYAGEIKKSIFSMMNFVMPQRDVLPMHGAANVSQDGQSALFFGLSGTGKTTLSADPDRRLIGDDEHGWSKDGIFNFEGGCYAKTIRLSYENEPQIWNAIRFGSILENVDINPIDGTLDYDSDRHTENTRVGYPVDFIDNCDLSGQADHPQAIIFLTADAFGVLPPISKLTREQAMYHFMAGYTSKLAGTERGITEPQVTFSACFGQCFFPRHASVYADMLGDRLLQHPETEVYLVNTGWSGGPYGVGQRLRIKHTRAMVAAALNGNLKDVDYWQDPIFKLWVPASVPGVPTEILNPKATWSDPDAYDRQSQELAERFVENFKQFTRARAEIIAAGPGVDG